MSEGNSLLADTLTMKDNIFSEYFELDINNDGSIDASEIGGSSFGALSLLDADNNKKISGDELSKVKIWRDNDADGVIDVGELGSVNEINLENILVTGEAIQNNGNTVATSLRKASITSETGVNDIFEVGLGYEAVSSGASSGITPAEYVFWVDANANDAVETSEVAASKLDGISEGGTDPTNSDLANLGFTLNNSPSSGTSLITLRGLPDILSLNKGAKTSTGDWLVNNQ